MNWEKQVCNLQLSKRLKELGVEQKSWLYWCEACGSIEEKEADLPCKQMSGSDPLPHMYVSAFTTLEFFQLLPTTFEGEYMDLYKDVKGWVCGYGKKQWFIEETMADAMAKMLVYLLENKNINY